jgi:hypothetical protein
VIVVEVGVDLGMVVEGVGRVVVVALLTVVVDVDVDVM